MIELKVVNNFSLDVNKIFVTIINTQLQAISY